MCKNVNTVPPLNAAMNSLGIFTTIRYDRNRFLFTDERGNTTPVNATAIAGNSSLQMGIAGFIAGLPNIPELGNSVSVPVCFDLACPNCYSSYNISRSLDLKEGGYAACVSCGRTYDLNNQGQIAIGEAGSTCSATTSPIRATPWSSTTAKKQTKIWHKQGNALSLQPLSSHALRK